MNETTMRRALLAVALVGLCAGLASQFFERSDIAAVIWTAATVPVVLTLTLAIFRDLWAGRFGVDAIALLSMAGALALGEPLAGIVVAVMYAGGTVLEDFARGRAERDLTALTDRSPHVAHRKSAETLETIPVDEVKVGDELFVRAGELVPVDGTLIDASAVIDESAVTGEPLPENRNAGDGLRSGTVNAGEPFLMRATALSSRSTYSAIVNMVAVAHTERAPFIRMADRFAMMMLPATITLAGLAWYVSGDPVRALAVLVVATPCPLILAAPVAFIGGVARAARSGILMKGSAALEALAEARTAVFDKTGTLTYGGADLIEVDTVPGQDQDEALRLLASLEQASHHVIAEHIVALARQKNLALANPSAVLEYRGSGLRGVVEGVEVSAGSGSLILADKPVPLWAERGELRYRGQPVLRVFLALDGRPAAVFTFGDALRADARTTLENLRSYGISRLVMLTGDDAVTAARVAADAGISIVVADAKPEDKVATVKAEMSRAPTLMIGDGINDAPALATATVGVAMGARGASATSQAADVIILTNRLQPLASAIQIARRTRSIARQSIIVGLTLSGTAMIAAAFGLITPVAGALLQEGIDVAVILNALRALGSSSPG